MKPDIIQDSHRKIAYKNIENWSGDILAIENSSEFEWNHKEPIEGLGPVGSGRTWFAQRLCGLVWRIPAKVEERLKILTPYV